jgi:peptide/nickel transport system substrate-binding protein
MIIKIIGILFLSIFLIFSGCISVSETEKKDIRDKITIGISFDVCGFHPWMESYDVDTMSINSNIFNSLVEFDNDVRLIPSLAKYWSNLDNVTWRFYLRENVKFHNGNNFTAEDVKYTINSIMGDSSNDLMTLLISIKDVIVIDEYTVDIITKYPNPILLNNLVDIYIVSKKYHEETKEKWPIGTGSYKLDEHAENEYISLERFDDYWGEQPDVKKVIFKIINDGEYKKNALLDGTIDICCVGPNYYDEVINLSDLKLKTISTPTVFYLGYDIREYNSTGFGEDKNPLSDVRIRKAIYYTININKIIKEELNGFADPASQFVSPFIFGYNPKIKRLPYDMESAKQLMNEAGYENGFNITLDCWDSNDTKKLCKNIANQLSEININVSVNPLSIDQYYSKIPMRNSSFYIIGWMAATLDSGEIFDFLIRTIDEKNGIGAYNYGYYSNPEIDEIGNQISSIMDPWERQQLIQLGFKIAMDDVALIPLYSPQVNFGYSDFIDWNPRPDLHLKVEEINLE